MGMLSGASLILCAVMFIGASREETGRYQVVDVEYAMSNENGKSFDKKAVMKVDTKTGKTWRHVRMIKGGKVLEFWKATGRDYDIDEYIDFDE